MRWLHLTIVCVFTAAALVFAFQNFQPTQISFLNLTAQVPFAVLVTMTYALGAVTGGSLLALLRRSIKGAQRVGQE